MDPQRSSEKACASRASINATSLDDIRSPGSTPVVNIRHEDSEPWKSRELCLSQRLFHNQKLNRVLERPQITGECNCPYMSPHLRAGMVGMSAPSMS